MSIPKFFAPTILCFSSYALCQAPSNIQIEPLEAQDHAEGSGCSFSVVRSDGVSELGAVLELFSVIGQEDISIRMNGNLLRLKWEPKRIIYSPGSEFSGAWSNGKTTVQLNCRTASDGENGSYYNGVLVVRVGKFRRVYKVNGFCGC